MLYPFLALGRLQIGWRHCVLRGCARPRKGSGMSEGTPSFDEVYATHHARIRRYLDLVGSRAGAVVRGS